MRRVIIESPFANPDPLQHRLNVLYLKLALQDSLARGEAPFASHRMYTEALDDNVPEQRVMGIAAGQAWMEAANVVVVYCDRGISDGMLQGIRLAERLGKDVEYRNLGGEQHDQAIFG